MSKTNELRELIKKRITTICPNVYYEVASDEHIYPHIVFSFGTIDNGDLSRDDLYMDLDLWDKGKSAVSIEDLADQVEVLFQNQNLPQETILPTFYLIDRKSIPDEDKLIRHRLIRVQIQNYER